MEGVQQKGKEDTDLRLFMHTPVLLQKAIENLNVSTGGKYIDATFGEGGYSYEILERGGTVLGIDLDFSQISNPKSQIQNLKLVQGNFADIESIAKENGFYPVDGVIFDLGLSMRQIKESGRGFSYKKLDDPLDMRLNINYKLTAEELIKRSDEKVLYEIFAKNSEEIRSKEIAAVVKSRKVMKSVGDLVSSIDRAIGYKSSSVYARIFQALRIEVNNEFENLKKGLTGAVNILKRKGRIVIVSFHSLEDRIVKNFSREKKLNFLSKKPITGLRSFERSAKLRTIISS